MVHIGQLPVPEQGCPIIPIINGNRGSEGKRVSETMELESVCTAVRDLPTLSPVLSASNCRLALAWTSVFRLRGQTFPTAVTRVEAGLA